LARKKAEAKIVKLVLIKEGTFHIPVTGKECGRDVNYVPIRYPLMIIGAGQEKTIIHGGFKIEGTKEEKKRVDMQGMTMKGSSGYGLRAMNGLLSFLCKDMTFTQCGWNGVVVGNTKGRLINCVITQCGNSGIYCTSNGLIELEGDQTKVDGNVTSGNSYSGLSTYDTSSTIHLLFPLTQESVSINNGGGGNYGNYNSVGTIKTVDTLESL
jgi:hypothetical protein